MLLASLNVRIVKTDIHSDASDSMYRVKEPKVLEMGNMLFYVGDRISNGLT